MNVDLSRLNKSLFGSCTTPTSQPSFPAYAVTLMDRRRCHFWDLEGILCAVCTLQLGLFLSLFFFMFSTGTLFHVVHIFFKEFLSALPWG